MSAACTSARHNEETAVAGLVLLLGGGALSAFLFFLSDTIVGGAVLASGGLAVGAVGYILRRRFGSLGQDWDQADMYCSQCNRTTTAYRKKFDQAPHVALTIGTCGAWAVGWGICWLVQKRWRCAGCESIVAPNASPADGT